MTRTRQVRRDATKQWAEALQRSASVVEELDELARRRARRRKIRLLLLVVVAVLLLPVIPRLSMRTLYIVAVLMDAAVAAYGALRLGGVLGGAK